MKKLSLLILLLANYAYVSASQPENMPDTVFDTIVEQVITDSGYYDSVAIEQAISQWLLDQPLADSDGTLLQSGPCSDCSADNQGTDTTFPQPRRVKIKAKKRRNGSYTTTYKIKWKKPVNLPANSPYELSHYNVFVSKDGQSYELFEVTPKRKRNGKLRKRQKIKFKDKAKGDYTVQVQAVYVESASINKSKSSTKGVVYVASGWTNEKLFSLTRNDLYVSDLTGALRECIKGAGYGNRTALKTFTKIDCSNANLQNSDILQIEDFYNLRSLIIDTNPSVTNISPLKNLPYLSLLSLEGNTNINLNLGKIIELTDLYLGNMGLTTLPDLTSQSKLEFLDLSNNQIVSGFKKLPDSLTVLKLNNNLVSGCFGLEGLEIESIEVQGEKFISISDCSGVIGLKYLSVKDAPNFAGNQNINEFAGLCGLNIDNSSITKLKGARPVNFLSLTNNKQLFKNNIIKIARNEVNSTNGGLYINPALIPKQVILTGSNNMLCDALNEKKSLWDNNSALDMTVAVTTTVNSIERTMSACPDSKLPAKFELPQQCATSSETIGFPIYSDFIQDASNFEQAASNSSIIPEVSGVKIPETFLIEIPNEKIQIQNLSVNYEYDDVVISGPNGLDLVVKRKLGGFQLLSKISRFKPGFCTTGIDQVKVEVIIPRVEMTTVGFSATTTLPAGMLMAFSNGYILKCNADNIPIILTDDGTTYTFGKQIDKADWVASLTHYVSSIEDRFGNKITYNYGADTSNPLGSYHFVNLESISRNDGAQIDFTYETYDGYEYLIKATYGSRQVEYVYVKQPWGVGGAPWKIETFIDQEQRETYYKYWSLNRKLKEMTTPTGLKVEYTYHILDPDFGYNEELRERHVSGPDIETNSIIYITNDWGINTKQLVIEQSFDTYDLIRMIIFNYAGTNSLYGANEKALDNVLVGRVTEDMYYYDSDPTPIGRDLELLYKQTNDWGYYRAGSKGCPIIYGFQTDTFAEFKICARAILNKQTTYYQVKDNSGASVFDTFVNDPVYYDEFGYLRETKTSAVNSTSNNRYIRQQYLHDTANWVLGLPTVSSISSDNVNWTETSKNIYWPSTNDYKSKLKYQYSYGQVNKYYQQYHTTGDLKKVKDSGTNNYLLYENYKYGIQQKTTIPGRYVAAETKFATQVVNQYGEITSTTNYDNTTTDFAYDNLSRPTLIDYKECDTPSNCTYQNDITTYNDTLKTITKTKGNYKEVQTYDSLSRLRSKTIEDTTDISTRVYQDYDYDINGRLISESFPYNNAQLNGTGKNIAYEYDYLNRKTKETVYDSNTVTTRYIDYFSNQRIKFTDGRNYPTIVTYLSYGDIGFDKPKLIQQFDSNPTRGGAEIEPPSVGTDITTTINYNLFGKTTSISQGGITEAHLYDTYQQLCKVVRPDTGKTAYGYYPSGLLQWQALGTTGSSTACGGETATDKITFAYDNLNELKTKEDSDGVFFSQTKWSVNNDSREVTTESETLGFLHGKRNQLYEKAVDGWGRITYYDYNDMGNLYHILYPDLTSQLLYTQNALGQIKTITENVGANENVTVTNINYHPSGGLLGYTLGNGISRTIKRKNSGLPKEIKDTLGGTLKFKHNYAYDSEFNLSSLTDGTNASYNLSNITYDGLNRLKTLSSGNWGTTNFNYDTMSNIKQMKLGNQTINYTYHPTTKRLSSISGSANQSFAYDNAGNITNNGSRGFTYDKQNRLEESGNISFVYDSDNLLRKKTVTGETPKYSIYGKDQQLLLSYEDLIGTNDSKYYYLKDQLIAKIKTVNGDNVNREIIYQHTDSLGSLSAESDVNGNITKRYHYEPFGFALESGQEDSPGFTGHVYDDDLGLNYMKARYYDPQIGRFYSNDPIGFDANNPMTFNRYSYANNNPYKYVDKTGENIVLWIGGIGAGVIDFVKGEGFNKDNNLGGALVDGYNGSAKDIAGAALEDISELVPVAKGAKYLGKFGKWFKNKFGKGKCCFVAGTQVLTKGGYKNIEDVKLDEMVWAKNVETGESDWKPVSKIYIEKDRGIFNLKLAKPDGQIINIQTTDDHPFYTKDHVWKTTIELQIGDFIETKEIGNVKVIEVIDEKREDITYNFEIADFHTYYVTEFGVLVHNCPETRTGSSKAEKHGDSGRAMKKAVERNKEIDKQIEKATGKKAKNKLKKKQQNNIKDAQKKDSGINDNNRGVKK